MTKATTPTAAVPATRPAMAGAPGDDPPLSLNFRDASMQTVLEYLSGAAGMVIIEEAKVEGKITVMSRQGLSKDEAIDLLDSLLKAKGYAAIRNGRTLKIVTLDEAKKESIPVRSGNDPEKIVASDRIITQIIPIGNADAAKLKADLAPLIPTTADVAANASSNTLIVTGTESTIRHLVEIIRAIDVHMSEVTQVRVIQLKYANATSAAKLIMDIFKEDQPSTTNGGFGGRRAFQFPGMPGFGAPAGQSDSASAQKAVKVTASADDRTNTLVVSASPDALKVIEDMVKQLDANPAADQAVFSYRVRNGNAKNMESVINNIFGWSGSTPYSSNSNSRQNTSFNGLNGGTFGGGFGNNSGSRSSSGSGRGLSGGNGGNSSRGLGSNMGNQGRTNTGGGFVYGGNNGRNMSAGSTAAASDLSGQVYVVADEDTNTLLITTASKNFARVRAIIAEMDRPLPQVLIKVLVAEVTHENSLDLGVEFSGMNLSGTGQGFKVGTDFNVHPQRNGAIFTLDEKYVTAAIRALANTTKLDVLSRPYILTSDNQEATILVGQSVPFVTNTQVFDTGTINNSITYEDIGIILDVTPHINPEGTVTLDVYPEISTLTGETVPISETLNAPVIAKRFAQTRVAIKDGQTIVIGGLMEDRITKSVDKVPILGDIPCLGAIFSRTVEKKTKTELLIFLTPHVAQQPDELKSMSESEKNGTKLIPGAVEKGAFDEHLRGMDRGASTRPASTARTLENGYEEMTPTDAPPPATQPAHTEDTDEH